MIREHMQNSVLIGALVLAAQTTALAQPFPAKPMRMLVPFSAGSGTDILARTVAQKMAEDWGQQVVVENRPGAGGSVAANAVLSSAADGHTMILVSAGHAANATLYRKLPYDTIKDFAGVSIVASTPNVLVVADTLAAFPETARVPFRVMAEKVRAGGMEAVLQTAIGRMFPPAFAAANPDIVAARKAALATVDADCFARACLALAGLDLQSQLARIGNPTLVLCGSLDQTTPPPLARHLAQGIPGAQFREIADSGHCPMLEQPDELVAAIHAFLTTEVRLTP